MHDTSQGETIYIGQQYIAQGLIFNRSASISAVHLVGKCPVNQSCFVDFQIWSVINITPTRDWTLSVLHKYPITLRHTSSTLFSTSVSITRTVIPVDTGNVVGFSAPNDGGNRTPLEILITTVTTTIKSDTPYYNYATTTEAGISYMVFGFHGSPTPSVLSRQQAVTKSQAVPLISVEGKCI